MAPSAKMEEKCNHPLTRKWGNSSGKGVKCLLCKKELSMDTDAPDEKAASSKKDQSRKKGGQNDEKQVEAIVLVNQALLAAKDVEKALSEALAAEDESTRKARPRVACARASGEITANLGAAVALLGQAAP